MTSVAHFGAWQAREGDAKNPDDAWWRMVARATSYDHQILRPSRLVDDKAVWAARLPRRRFGSEESEAVRGRFSGANCGAWLAFG